MPGYSIKYYMAVFFPWPEWRLHEYISEEEGSYEVAQHILYVTLSEVGKTALTLETFYQSDLSPFRPKLEELYIPDDRDEDDY